MASPMQYQIQEKENAIYLCLEGDLDDKSFLDVSRVLTGRDLDMPVKVDLEKVSYANSTGLRALVLLQRQARDAGVDFVLLEPSDAIKRLFKTTGLAEIFDITADDPENPC